MINGEKYKNEILEHVCPLDSFALLKGNKIVRCCEASCTECSFNGTGGCDFETKFKWLLSEYKEPIKLSRLEYEILKWAKKEGYKYIVRTSSNGVFVHANKPNKLNYCWASEDVNDEYLGMFNKFFQFVKWEDEEPTLIEEVLNNCEVIEDA